MCVYFMCVLTGEKKKLQSKLRAVESKIAMTRRMLADLEDAEVKYNKKK